MDSYANMTLAHLSLYQWIYLQCHHEDNSSMPPWIFKADDDFVLNIDAALEVADANPEAGLM